MNYTCKKNQCTILVKEGSSVMVGLWVGKACANMRLTLLMRSPGGGCTNEMVTLYTG